jgi:DNA-3-methyladenine glycosylase
MRSEPEGDLTWTWPASAPRAESLGQEFFRGNAAAVARALIGSVLRSTFGGEEVVGVVVEAEAYLSPQDPASHAAWPRGMTPRNRSMFGPPGRAYVYRSYGIHWCLNVVTGPEGFPAAVLFRALDPLLGQEVMNRRRGGRLPLCSGPGRLCQALHVGGGLDGHDLRHPPLQLLRGWTVPEHRLGISGRVGVRRAAEWPLRFFLRGHEAVSRGPGGSRIGAGHAWSDAALEVLGSPPVFQPGDTETA